MDIIMDTNISSTFQKIDRFDLLQNLFPNSKLFISNSVEEELSKMENGQKFLKKIKKISRKIKMNKKEENYVKYLQSKRSIGKAEAECISITKFRKMLLLTNDKIAVKESREAGADVMDLRAIIRELWKQNVLSKENAEALINEIEEKDNIIFADKDKILSD